MRIEDFLTEAKLSFADAKKMLQHVDTARGQAVEVARDNPWLTERSQQAARERLGATFSVYRAVTLTGDLRPERVVSTSLDWQVAWNIADDAPGMIWHGDKTLTTTTALLHYRLTPERVVLWLPEVMAEVRTAVGKRANHSIEDRYGNPKRIEQVLRFLDANDEQEIIADVSGLTPKVLRFGRSVRERERLHLLHDVLRGANDPKKLRRDFLGDADLKQALRDFERWRTP